MAEHEHIYETHYRSIDWQEPLFLKCQECGSTYYLARKNLLTSAERLADAAENVLYTVCVPEDLEELRNAWQAYVDAAPE